MNDRPEEKTDSTQSQFLTALDAALDDRRLAAMTMTVRDGKIVVARKRVEFTGDEPPAPAA